MSDRIGKYVYWETNGQWYFNKVAANGEVTMTSGGEGFSTKGNCIQAIGRDMEDSSGYAITERPPQEQPATLAE